MLYIIKASEQWIMEACSAPQAFKNMFGLFPNQVQDADDLENPPSRVVSCMDFGGYVKLSFADGSIVRVVPRDNR